MTFTGGTTGRPKGAVVSHTARFVSAASTAREHQVTAQDVVGVVTPMFHAVGLMIWYQGLDPGREHCRDLPQVGPRGVHRRSRAPPDLVGVPGAGPGPRPAPFPRLRSGPAGFAQEPRSRWRADASGPDRGVPEGAAALRLHRSLRAIRDRTADDPQALGYGDARRHRRSGGGGSGPPDRGPGRKPGPARRHRRSGGAGAVPDGGLLRGRRGNRPLFPRRVGMDGRSREIRRRRLPHAGGEIPGDHHLGRFQHSPLRGRDRARKPPRSRGLHGLRRPRRALGGGAGGLRGPGG